MTATLRTEEHANTQETARECVTWAIWRIRKAITRFRTTEALASATTRDRAEAKEYLDATVRDFAIQWGNVAFLLEIPEEKK